MMQPLKELGIFIVSDMEEWYLAHYEKKKTSKVNFKIIYRV